MKLTMQSIRQKREQHQQHTLRKAATLQLKYLTIKNLKRSLQSTLKVIINIFSSFHLHFAGKNKRIWMGGENERPWEKFDTCART